MTKLINKIRAVNRIIRSENRKLKKKKRKRNNYKLNTTYNSSK